MRIFSPFLKGQGATEYLVLLAVVLIIALVSISLLGFFPGVAFDSRLAQNHAYWSGQAYPIRIHEVTFAPMYGGYPNTCGYLFYTGYRMAIQNMMADTITVEDICFPGNEPQCANYSAQLVCNSLPFSTFPSLIKIAPGEKKTVDVLDYSVPFLTPGCDTSKNIIYEKEVKIVYYSPYGVRNVQIGSKPLIFRCEYTNN
jgi:hypothetical protein